MKTIEKICCGCKSSFMANLKEHKRGFAKFCSRKCFDSSRITKNKKHNCSCYVCETSFYRSLSKKSAPKSGILFCSRGCKEIAQTLKYNLKEIQPAHYGSGQGYNYRQLAFDTFEHCCSDCGYNTYPEILQVHHKDHSRKNNKIDNLEILCPNCHQIKHYFARLEISKIKSDHMKSGN